MIMSKNLLFDYDGTLHNNIKIFAPAFRTAYAHLVSLGHAEPREFSDYDISHWTGYTETEMWAEFMPNLPQALQHEAGAMIESEMLHLLRTGGASLYDGVLEMLGTLCDADYRLIFLSNCMHNYMATHREQFGLDAWFTDFFCAEDYNFSPKHEVFPIIRQKHPGDYIVIGDRFHDMEVARIHGLKSIGCAYGYARPEELAHATVRVTSPADIVTAVDSLAL